jgi:hypothetical protein
MLPTRNALICRCAENVSGQTMKRIRQIAYAAIALVALSTSTQAQYVEKWFYGKWNCTVGGAAGELTWGIGGGKPNPGAAACKGCVISDDAPLGGTFSVVGLAPTYLSEQGSSAQAVYMQGDDGILWYLDDTATGPTQMAGRAGDAHGNWSKVTCARPRLRPDSTFGQH